VITFHTQNEAPILIDEQIQLTSTVLQTKRSESSAIEIKSTNHIEPSEPSEPSGSPGAAQSSPSSESSLVQPDQHIHNSFILSPAHTHNKIDEPYTLKHLLNLLECINKHPNEL
jgi:hypothetical protein